MIATNPNPVVVRKLGRSVTRLRGIELEHAAEPLTAADRGAVRVTRSSADELVAQTLVQSFLVIMIHDRADGSPEVFLAERHDAFVMAMDGWH